MKLTIIAALILLSAGCSPVQRVAGPGSAQPERGAVFYKQFFLVSVERSTDSENWHVAEASFKNERERKVIRIRLNAQPLPSTRLEGAFLDVDGVLTVVAWDIVSNNGLCFGRDGAVRFASERDRVRLLRGC